MACAKRRKLVLTRLHAAALSVSFVNQTAGVAQPFHFFLGRHTKFTVHQMPPPEETLGYCTGAQEVVSTKCRKKFGSSMAYKTIGTFSSQE